MRDTDLDRILAVWLADSGERVPRLYLDAALAEIATTDQRPAWRARSSDLTGSPVAYRTRLLIAAALLAILAIGVAIGIGAALVREPMPLPPQVVVPSASAPTVDLELVPLAIEDYPVQVSVPLGWSEIEGPCCDYRQFSGTSPEGHLSAGHESPYVTAVCDPDCHDIEVPQTIPYDTAKQFGALKAAVENIAGSAAWADLPPDLLPGIEGGLWLDTTGTAADDREWRRVYVVGLRERNLVAVTFSQPADVFDPAVLDAVLGAMQLKEAPIYSDGDLIPSPQDDFSMPIPGSWQTLSQPTLDEIGLSGARQFGDGEVFVSIGDDAGTLGWCDPDCREIAGIVSLDALAAEIVEGQGYGAPAAITLGGEPALEFESIDPARRVVVALHAGRPVALRIETRDWDVEPGILDQMVAGFEFIDPVAAPAGRVVLVADGRAELDLPDAWEIPETPDEPFTLPSDMEMTVRSGDQDGAILTCDTPAAPWELCRTVTATSLEELEAAVMPAPIDDHGVGPPTPTREETVIDGEPSVILRIQAYEYPAQGGQGLAYVITMHEGRPYIIRLHTRLDSIPDVDFLVRGLRFLD